MSNPFFNGGGSNLGQMKQIFNMLKFSKNPEQLLNNLLQQNPQMAQTINLIRSNGNYEQVFRNMCKERGINADDFIKQMNS